jgi:hypothetical protein
VSSHFVGPRRLVPATLRGHLRSNGEPKRKYGELAAEHAAERLHKNAYKCSDCGFWHLGGQRTEDRQ